MVKILFICHGNICRSPMAEYIFKNMTEQNRRSASESGRKFPEFYIASAATSLEELGNPVHRGTREILRRLGIDCSEKRARQMTWRDYEEYDYLIGMDQWNILNMQRIAGGDPQKKMYRLLDFTEEPGDVADPWYTGDFETTYQDVVRGCQGFLEYILKGGER